ncbi:Zinc finger and BTB domain-containing protein 41 [Turdus rufiventris]|nr:Zinc finger and BTB domain-containing protein 41 [Turdus rufiventris]
MKKRRRLAASLNEKVHLGHEKDTSEQILVVDCAQQIVSKSAEIAPADQIESSQELSPSPEQRKLLSSLQYNKNLLKYLNDDRQKHPSFCDLLIIVEGKEFSAHKVVVAVGSSYFHACLSKNPSTDVVTLDHVTHSVFQHLLEFLYTSEFFVYKNEIPLVLEAAKFLDIIDAVKLLNNESVSNVPTDVVTDAPTPVETLSELTGKLLNSHQCTFCGRSFCYKKSLENHLAKAHQALSLERKHGLKMVEKATFSTRRSTRSRKCPAKFDISDNESGDASDSNLEKVSSDKETSERSEFEDSESECNVDEDGQEEEMSGEDSESEEQSEKEQNDAEEGSEAADSVGNIPEGLAPVIIQSSSKKLLQCPKCDKKFDRIGKYESHTRVHTGEKPFECDICHQRYSTKSNLTVHRKKHSSDTDFHKKEHKCPYCNKLHASKKTLAKHVKRQLMCIENGLELKAGPFPCDICGRQFNDTGNLKRHIECTHGGKRKWTCFICGKSVRERLHLRVHHDDKRYECEECGKTFIRHDHLTKHKKIHSGEKPYKCQICNQSFRIKKTLTKHMVIHSDARPFNCQHCNATFKRKDKLKYHIDHVHGSKAAEEALASSPEEKLVSLPVQYTSDDKVYQTEAKQYVEQSKAYQSEAKTLLQNVSPEVCVPVTLVPVPMADPQAELVQHTAQSHGILPPQPEQPDYQRATELSFLEKYTLTPQPANIVHPVRPEQMLDPRDQSYLGTLLGLDTTPTVQNISSNEHS